jgi:hypothetical protein
VKQLIKAVIPTETWFGTKDKDKEFRTIYEPDHDCGKRFNW